MEVSTPADGLDDKHAVVKQFIESLMNDEPPPQFDPVTGIVRPSRPEEPITFKRALGAVAGYKLHRMPKARFFPAVPPIAEVCDLNIRDFHGQNDVKHVVDVISGHDGVIDVVGIKKAVGDGKFDDSHHVLRLPVGHIAVNHFQQFAVIDRGAGKSDIVRWITFQAEGTDQGKVASEVAASHRQGALHLINYGSNQYNGRKVFAHVFEQLGGIQFRQWEFQEGRR